MNIEDDDDDFLKWKENNSKAKPDKKTGLPPRSKRLVKVNKCSTRTKKKRVSKRDRWTKKKIHVYSRNREIDFMKYSLLVEHWAMTQYDLTREELALMYYFYSETYFTKDAFLEQSRLITRKTVFQFDKFLEKGIITEIPREDVATGEKIGVKSIYRLSFKACNRVKSVYNRLLLHTKVSEDHRKTIMFRKRVSTDKDKRLAEAVRRMNKDIDDIRAGGRGYIDDDFIDFTT